MTDTTTQAAAQRCADLANAVRADRNMKPLWNATNYIDPIASGEEAFRRYVERIDARDREVLEEATELLSITAHPTQVKRLNAIIAKLRADLLPDPAPTLLEEFERDRRITVKGDTRDVMEAFADWIAKREGYSNAGDLDAGTPNHFDHTKRGFQP